MSLLDNFSLMSELDYRYSARFSQKVVSDKKPPTPKNLAAHLETVPLIPKFSRKNCHQVLKI